MHLQGPSPDTGYGKLAGDDESNSDESDSGGDGDFENLERITLTEVCAEKAGRRWTMKSTPTTLVVVVYKRL